MSRYNEKVLHEGTWPNENRGNKSGGIHKVVLVSLLLLSGVIPAWAQEPATKSFWDDPTNDPLFPVFLLSLFVLAVLAVTVVVAVIAIRVLNLFAEQTAREKAARLGIPYKAPESIWQSIWQKANGMSPLEEEKSIELDHNYDGIRELDNHLPPWWKGLFYASIVFAVIYLIMYHLSDSMPLSEQEYENELASAEERARIWRASQPAEVIDENTLVFNADPAMVAKGKQLFISNNCQSCHRNDGGGNTIGPNLTDEYWLHGGDIKSVFSTINNGVVEKAMPAWGKVMSRKDVRDLAFFIMSLQGSNPENGKKPQGELVKPTKPEPADSTKISMTQ